MESLTSLSLTCCEDYVTIASSLFRCLHCYKHRSIPRSCCLTTHVLPVGESHFGASSILTRVFYGVSDWNLLIKFVIEEWGAIDKPLSIHFDRLGSVTCLHVLCERDRNVISWCLKLSQCYLEGIPFAESHIQIFFNSIDFTM